MGNHIYICWRKAKKFSIRKFDDHLKKKRIPRKMKKYVPKKIKGKILLSQYRIMEREIVNDLNAVILKKMNETNSILARKLNTDLDFESSIGFNSEEKVLEPIEPDSKLCKLSKLHKIDYYELLRLHEKQKRKGPAPTLPSVKKSDNYKNSSLKVKEKTTFQSKNLKEPFLFNNDTENISENSSSYETVKSFKSSYASPTQTNYSSTSDNTLSANDFRTAEYTDNKDNSSTSDDSFFFSRKNPVIYDNFILLDKSSNKEHHFANKVKSIHVLGSYEDNYWATKSTKRKNYEYKTVTNKNKCDKKIISYHYKEDEFNDKIHDKKNKKSVRKNKKDKNFIKEYSGNCTYWI
ncbi:hypothetical protein SNEBB_002024 [Seison nebaliae]|nr:hypothetical protein SNEBB_002024 [Seison nebaliae]